MSRKAMCTKDISILLLEDSAADAELIRHTLTLAGIEIDVCTAYSGKEYSAALDTMNPDIILADFHVPSFNGFLALDMAREKFPKVPFIFVTGAVGEERAVETLQRGATDFILKSNLDRLIPAVKRALRESTVARERIFLYNALKEEAERYNSLVKNLPVGIFRSSMAGRGRILQANPALMRLYGGVEVEELYSLSIVDLYCDPSERDVVLQEIIEKGGLQGLDLRMKKKDGTIRWARITASPHRDDTGQIDWIDGIIDDVTESKEANEDLKSRNQFLETLIDTINNPVFYKDNSGKYLGCNRAFAEIVIGLPRKDIIGKTVFDMPDAIPFDLAEKYNARDNELYNNPGVQEYDARVQCADGKTRHYHFNKATYTDATDVTAGIVGVMLDITERVDAELELRRKHEELDLFLNSIASIIIGVSIKDRITHWNPYAEDVFGIKSEAVVNRPFVSCGINWEWTLIYEAMSDCLIQERTIRLDDVKYVRQDGRDGLLGLTINPLKRGGDVLEGFIFLGRDLTERRNLEHQLLQARKLEAIGQLAAGVAHEINSPLQYVGDNLNFLSRALSDVLGFLATNRERMTISERDTEDTGTFASANHSETVDIAYYLEQMPKAIEQSKEGIARVSNIVRSMKAFAHPGSGTKSPADINKSIENTVTVSRNEWKYDCELELELDPNLPQVPCFETELNQVVLNLIINSVDAVKEARDKGLIEQGRIRICTAIEGDWFIIRITDNGIGIPETIRDRLFDPFFTTKGVGKGTGQGLAIAHAIIADKHGGSIYCDFTVNNGAAFVIRLPLEG